ncbi:MAG: ROK family protein [Anaerolineales bacterium]|jgi:glucokinase
MKANIAVDIGGTRMRAGSYPSNQQIPLKLKRISTGSSGNDPLDELIELIESIWVHDKEILSMGVAAPGPLDLDKGMVLAAPNIPKWVDFPLKKHLEDHFGIPVALGNDANLAALGEWKFGAGQGHRDIVYLTVSTGIGGGVISNNQLIQGARGLASELGHITIEPNGPICSCGKMGHLEAVASGPAIVRWVTKQLSKGARSIHSSKKDELTARSIAEAARSGDSLSQTAFERAGTYIGRAIADLLHIFNPTAVIIGGGVSQSGDLLMKPIKLSMRKYVFSEHFLEDLKVSTASLGDDVGLLGALTIARQCSLDG